MKNYTIIVLILVLLSCKKKDNHTVITGQILHAKDSSAYANTSFIVYQPMVKGVFHHPEQTVPFTTDSTGSFSISIILEGTGVEICFPDKTLIAGKDLYGTIGPCNFGKIYY